MGEGADLLSFPGTGAWVPQEMVHRPAFRLSTPDLHHLLTQEQVNVVALHRTCLFTHVCVFPLQQLVRGAATAPPLPAPAPRYSATTAVGEVSTSDSALGAATTASAYSEDFGPQSNSTIASEVGVSFTQAPPRYQTSRQR